MYQPCPICDAHYTLSNKDRIQLSASLNIPDVVANAINQLFEEGKIDAATKKQLFQSHYEPLKKAVNEGFQGKVEYGTPNYEFLKQLQTNTAVFAMFKSHASIKDMVSLLKDENGNLRTKADFLKQAKQLDDKYRTQYLDVEYDTAVRTARLASHWAKFEKNKRIYPNLRYLLTKAAKPDKKHLAFVGIIRPIDDAFWDTHYPPNRWRCQCSVEQTDSEATDIPANLPAVAEGFRFNAGKMGQIFDVKNVEYIKSVPLKEQPALIKLAQNEINNQAAIDATYQPVYKSKSGNTQIEAHPLSFKNSDYKQNFDIAKDIANSKIKIDVIQIIPLIDDKPLRKQIFPDAKGLKNADFRFDGKLIDAKEPSLKTAGGCTIQNRISKANQQADGIILKLPTNYITRQKLFEDIYAKMHHPAYNHFEIYLKYGEEWSHYTRDSFLQAYNQLKKP